MEFLEIVKQFGGWLTSLLFGGLLLRLKFRKANLDDTSVAFEALQKICERNENEISTLRSRLHETDGLLDRERRERREAEDKYHLQINELRDQVEGLKRAIIQNSRSAVQVIDGGKNA